MTSSSSTKRTGVAPGGDTTTTRSSTAGTWTTAKWRRGSPPLARSTTSAMLRLLLWTCGKGWPGSIASGVSTGWTLARNSVSTWRRSASPRSSSRARSMPPAARPGNTSSFRMRYCPATSSCARRSMAPSCSAGAILSAPKSWGSTPAYTCCCNPATRISKNSSRLELKIARNLSRSSHGLVASAASSSTRALNSSQESSRLR